MTLLLAGAMGANFRGAATDRITAETVARRELLASLFNWIEATNARDLAAQSVFYPQRMDAFYLWRDVARTAVLAEKRRSFDRALVVDIRAEAPQIILDPDAETARMYFRKSYVINGVEHGRTGEVLQELRWEKQVDGWKIVSERDLRVIRSARSSSQKGSRAAHQ